MEELPAPCVGSAFVLRKPAYSNKIHLHSVHKAKASRRVIADEPRCRKQGITWGGRREVEVVLMSDSCSSERLRYAINTAYLT